MQEDVRSKLEVEHLLLTVIGCLFELLKAEPGPGWTSRTLADPEWTPSKLPVPSIHCIQLLDGNAASHLYCSIQIINRPVSLQLF